METYGVPNSKRNETQNQMYIVINFLIEFGLISLPTTYSVRC